MGRPKLDRTKEQIAIRLAPGTKARLDALLTALQRRSRTAIIRSELLRLAIERGIAQMEAEAASARTASSVLSSKPPPPAARSSVPRSTRAPAPQPLSSPRAASSAPGASVHAGTLEERTLRQIERLAPQHGAVLSIPDVCRAAWPPNPVRVHDALRELARLGLVDLRAATAAQRSPPEDEGLLIPAPGGALGTVRLR